MVIVNLIKDLEKTISQKRFKHTIGVMETAEKLAKYYKADIKKCITAALLHDVTRELEVHEHLDICRKNNIKLEQIHLQTPELLHSLTAPIIAKNIYNINDVEIIEAIRYHTTGRQKMSLIEQILCVADYIEPNREIPGVKEVRDFAFEGIEKTLLIIIDRTIKNVIFKSAFLHQDTVYCRNWLLMSMHKVEGGNVK